MPTRHNQCLTWGLHFCSAGGSESCPFRNTFSHLLLEITSLCLAHNCTSSLPAASVSMERLKYSQSMISFQERQIYCKIDKKQKFIKNCLHYFRNVEKGLTRAKQEEVSQDLWTPGGSRLCFSLDPIQRSPWYFAHISSPLDRDFGAGQLAIMLP